MKRNETLRNLKINKSIGIERVFVNHDIINNNFYNINNKSFINYFCVRKIKGIILILLVASVIVGIIVFGVFYFIKVNKKSTAILLKQNITNINDKDGYYIPKDITLNTIYKKCSGDNCKKCYGNSNNDICISCNKSYEPIYDENNKIISCKYNPQKEDKNLTIKDSDKIKITDIISENMIDIITEIISNYNNGNNSELTKEKITYIIHENHSEIVTENIFENSSLTKSELISQVSLDNKSLINTTELITNVITDNITTRLSELITKEIADNKTETETKLVTSENIINCYPGFYLPEGDYTENKCKNCSILGCEKCHGNNTINYCDSCFSNYIPKYVNNNLICLPESVKNCINYDNITFECFKCDDEYSLYQGKCYTYSIGAEYFTDRDNQSIKLINLDNNYINKIIIEDKMINNSVYYNYFVLKQKGYHKVYFL